MSRTSRRMFSHNGQLVLHDTLTDENKDYTHNGNNDSNHSIYWALILCQELLDDRAVYKRDKASDLV